MATKKVLNGNAAIAEAIRQINPDVVAAYPITPSTSIVEYIAKFVADGLMTTEFVTPESEHSAMSMCVGASSAGARVFTATASQGLALMFEILYIAASLRLPIVAGIANRALSAPINIHGDHSDVMAVRDTGWIQIHSENAQEAYDNIIQAFRIGEHKDVSTPVLVTMDGFILSHAMQDMFVEEDSKVKAFVGEREPLFNILDADNPITVGPIDFTDYYFEHKRSQIVGIENAPKVILEVAEEFKKEFGREYGFLELYKMDDAEIAIVLLGSTAGTAKIVVDELREKGKKVGLVKIRVYRPFPTKELADILTNLKAVATLDRALSPGSIGGPLFLDLRSALYEYERKPIMVDYIYGLGGRDIAPHHIAEVYDRLEKIAATGERGEVLSYINLRE